MERRSVKQLQIGHGKICLFGTGLAASWPQFKGTQQTEGSILEFISPLLHHSITALFE